MIETTVNIDFRTYVILHQSAKELNGNLRDIVHILFKLMLAERPIEMKSFTRVKYQERIDGRVWKQFHLQLNEGSYEACLDLRKLCKMSVSFLLEIAVHLYLERAVEELKRQGGTDNYPEIYIILHHYSTNFPSFTVFHAMPLPEILTLFLVRSKKNKT